jgi:HK97 gp10 family phage protein
MADGITVQVKGLAQLEEALKEIGEQSRKALRSGVRAGLVVIQKDARTRINNISGDLAKSLTISVRVTPDQGTVTGKLKAGKKQGHIARFVELGTAAHEIKPRRAKALQLHGRQIVEKVDHPGARPKPFLRPAADTKFPDAVDAVAEVTKKSIEKIKARKP